MPRVPGRLRGLSIGAALGALLAGCQSAPPPGGPLPASSSLLGVDVRFPVSLGRDPTLARVWFVRGPIHDQQDALPELRAATLVKGSRAYLLDPEPGTWSLVAVLSDYAPPRSHVPIAGVTGAVVPGADAGDLIVFPAEMIHRTRTTIAPGAVKYMGTLELRPGDRVNADTIFLDPVQERLAEAIRPGISSASGLAGRFSTTFKLDRELSSWRDGPAERQAFVQSAADDFGTSPWVRVLLGPDPVTRETAKRETVVPRPRAPQPEASDAVPVPGADPAPVPRGVPETATRSAPSPSEDPEVPSAAAPETSAPAATGTSASAPSATSARAPAATSVAALPSGDARRKPPPPPPPPRVRFPDVPADSGLAAVEFGMSHDEVRSLLGEPDDKHRRHTARGWMPFYTGPDAIRIDWIYEDEGRVVFTVDEGSVTVVDVHAGDTR